MSKVRLQYEFNWKLTLFSILLFPILVSLGTWQLQRADEKEALLADWEEQQSLPPVPFNSEAKKQLRRVTVRGEYLPEKYWLKENQMLNGSLGYHVIMPFRVEETETVLAVDRGWVEGSPLRDFVPKIDTPEGIVEISGTLITPSDSKLIREADVRAKTWPHKILEEDLPVLGNQINQKLYPELLRIDPESRGALTVYWRPINISSAKHTGYAVQWYAMAIALFILYVFASTNLAAVLKKSD